MAQRHAGGLRCRPGLVRPVLVRPVLLLAVAVTLAAAAALAVAPSLRAGAAGHRAATTSHPATSLSRSARVGAGVVVASFDGHRLVETWSRRLPDAGGPIAMSSPTSAVVSGRRAVVVGDLAGNLWALQLSDGSTIPGWPYRSGAPIESSPSAAGGQVTFGVGSAADPAVAGGYRAVWASGRGSGTLRWSRTVTLTPSGGRVTGVAAGLAYGRLQGRIAVVGGSLGQLEDALTASSGRPLPGFPWFQADTQFDTPAVANLGHGNVIIQGGSSTANPHFHPPYYNGGHLRILSATGRPLCNHNTNEEMDSSPAVGRFLAGGAVGIVAGTGTYYPGVSDEDALIAMRTNCSVAWEIHLAGSTASSPALVRAQPGGLQIATGAANGQRGAAYLVDGATGRMIWSRPLDGAVIGGITSADLGGGLQDLLVPTTHGLYLLDGRTGRVLATVPYVGLQSSPLVTDDANGLIGITIAGYNGHGAGVVEHFEVTRTVGARADEVGAWPMFHHDPLLTGSALPASG